MVQFQSRILTENLTKIHDKFDILFVKEVIGLNFRNEVKNFGLVEFAEPEFASFNVRLSVDSVIILLVIGRVFAEFIEDFVGDDEVVLAVEKVAQFKCEFDVPEGSGR